MIDLIRQKGRIFHLLTICCIIFGFIAAGCDGSGGGGGGQGGSPYTGHYSGGWSDTGGTETGTWSFDVDAVGAMTGLFSRDGFDGKGIVGSGSIDSEGAFTFSCTGDLNLTMTGNIVEGQTGGQVIESAQLTGDITGTGDGGSAVWFAVVADPHFYDTDLGTSGEDFERALDYDNTLLLQNEAILEAGIDDILAQEPQFVIMIGDLTKGGSLASHQKFIQAVNRFHANGIQVYVTPGSRDIDNPRAYEYVGDDRESVDNVSKSEFLDLYADYGYNQAISRDTATLSYVVEPVEGLWLMSIDTAFHGSDPRETSSVRANPFSYEGAISATTMDWIKAQMAEAESLGKVVIAASYHGLTEHFTNQYQYYPESVIADWENDSEELRNSRLALAFTAGFHANDITRVQVEPQPGEPSGYKLLYDVETASLTGYPCAYRMVGFSIETGDTLVRTYRVQDIDYDLSGVDFQEYAELFLTDQLTNVVADILEYDYSVPELTSLELAPVGGRSLVAHYAGDEDIDTATETLIQTYLSNPDSQFYGQMLQTIWQDISPSDNNRSFNIWDVLYF